MIVLTETDTVHYINFIVGPINVYCRFQFWAILIIILWSKFMNLITEFI